MCVMEEKPLFILFKNIGSFQRPLPKQIITNFSFWGLSNDLHLFLDFLKETKGFINVQIGNKNFQLKTGDEELDHLNKEALMRLIKKSKNF
jgi:hypothetical protein